MTQAEQRVRIPQAVIVKDLAELLGVTPIDVPGGQPELDFVDIGVYYSV